MGFFSPDMESLLDIYQSETTELIEELDGYLIKMEEQHHFGAEEINGIFRIVHTNKSSSAMMGMDDMSAATHRLEEIFLLFRENPSLTVRYEERIADLLYAYSDYVRDEILNVMQEDFQPSKPLELMERIHRELLFYEEQKQKLFSKPREEETVQGTSGIFEKWGGGEVSGEKEMLPEEEPAADLSQKEIQKEPEEAQVSAKEIQKSETPETKLREEKSQDIKIQEKKFQEEEFQSEKKKLRVFLKKDCQMENVRAFLLVKQIQGFCETVFYKPEHLEQRETASLVRKNGFVLEVTSSQIHKIIKKLETSPYVQMVEDLEKAEILSPKIEKETGKKERGPEKGKKSPVPHTRTRNSKHANILWDTIVKLQEVTGELITSHTILDGMVEQMGNPRELEDFSLSFHRILGELESLVNTVSLMPVSSVVPQLRRIVRDICKKEKKKVHFTVEGEEILADKSLMDGILNPLMHLLRNAIDHGIEIPEERIQVGKREEGSVVLKVESAEGKVHFHVTDDGRGMDAEQIMKKAKEKKLLTKSEENYTEEEIIHFILMPGFSMTEHANEYSGRGVGMDVVRNTVDVLGGALDVKSEKGKGSEFTLHVPVSLTSVDSVHFMVGEIHCLIPIRNIERIYAMEEVKDQIMIVDGRELFQGEQMIPVLRMQEIFESARDENEYMLVLHGIKGDICIVIGEIKGQMVAVEKPLPPLLGTEYRNDTGISGCAIIGDGSLGMMLNVEKLRKRCQKELEEDARARHNR